MGGKSELGKKKLIQPPEIHSVFFFSFNNLLFFIFLNLFFPFIFISWSLINFMIL